LPEDLSGAAGCIGPRRRLSRGLRAGAVHRRHLVAGPCARSATAADRSPVATRHAATRQSCSPRRHRRSGCLAGWRRKGRCRGADDASLTGRVTELGRAAMIPTVDLHLGQLAPAIALLVTVLGTLM